MTADVHSTDPVEEALAQAKIAKTEGRLDDALAHYDAALALTERSTVVWRARGIVLDELGRFEEALASFRRSTEIEDNGSDRYNAGNMLLKLDRLDEALAQYERSIALKPGYAQAWVNRGIVLTRLDKPAAALLDFDRAIELDDQMPEAWRCKALLADTREDHRAAQAAWQRLTELQPNDVRAWLSLADALNSDPPWRIIETRREEAIIAVMDRVLALEPRSRVAWEQKLYRLQRMAHATGKTHVAYRRLATEAVALFPGAATFAEFLDDARALSGEQ